jgi:hypothetical protein
MYKYSIKEKLEQLPMTEYKKMKKQIPKALGKTQRTFDRFCTIKKSECGDIPTQDLDIIASCLGYEANDLKNYCITKQQIEDFINQRR